MAAKEIVGDDLDVVWEIHKLNTKREKLKRDKKREELIAELKDLPSNLIGELPLGTTGTDQRENPRTNLLDDFSERSDIT